MRKYEFVFIQEKLQDYKHHSMRYIKFQDVQDFICLRDDSNLILMSHTDDETGIREIHWAANDVKELVRGLKTMKSLMHQKPTKLAYIPKEWIQELRKEGFQMHAECQEYVMHNLKETLHTVYDLESIEFISAEEIESALNSARRKKYDDLIDQTFSEAWSVKDTGHLYKFEERNNDDQFTIIAHRNESRMVNGVIGFTLTSNSYQETELRIQEIVTQSNCDEFEITNDLVSKAISYGIHKGVSNAYILADACNLNAIDIYKRLGFQPYNEVSEIHMISTSRQSKFMVDYAKM